MTAMTLPPIRRWDPDGAAAARVVLVHGLAEHKGRYEHVGRRFAQAGFATVAFDLRGHGEAPGFPGLVSGPEDWIEDLTAVLEDARADGLPVMLIAHSMGTVVALATLARRGAEDVRALVLSGTAVAPGPALLESMADPDAPSIPPEALSHDPEMVRRYAEDPLVFNEKVPPETSAAVLLCAQMGFEGLGELRLPVLLVHGGEDVVCDPSGAQDVYDALGSKDKTLKVYPGLYHEIFNELEREAVLDDVVAWLDAHR